MKGVGEGGGGKEGVSSLSLWRIFHAMQSLERCVLGG